mgnify:CR=1 FL=1
MIGGKETNHCGCPHSVALGVFVDRAISSRKASFSSRFEMEFVRGAKMFA